MVPNLFLLHGQVHIGQMAMALYNFGSTQFHKMEIICTVVSKEICILQSLEPATHPDQYDNTPPAQKAYG